ncbi:MAG: adenylate/guanylate cyclase domain-containing protein, partial [Actinobacteria bacterium]|nr:adenylate/guanylate cyclase domain-containing protein [Actinomycetota bacterium]
MPGRPAVRLAVSRVRPGRRRSTARTPDSVSSLVRRPRRKPTGTPSPNRRTGRRSRSSVPGLSLPSTGAAWQNHPVPKPAETALRAVLFTDVVGSTELAREMGDVRWSRLLAAQRRVVRAELKRHHGREVDTAGDGFFAVFDGPAHAVRCGFAACRGVQDLGLDIRAGVHFGEVEMTGGGVHGIVVHTGARVMG